MNPWQNDVTLSKLSDGWQVNNPTPYYVIFSDASASLNGKTAVGFTPLVIAPQSQQKMAVKVSELGNTPVLTYVNDYGARLPLIFDCSGNACVVNKEKSRKA